MSRDPNSKNYNYDEEFFSTASLPKDLENDFLKKSPAITSFTGGNGVWIVKIICNIQVFKQLLKECSDTRVYMHPTVEIYNMAKWEVLIKI